MPRLRRIGLRTSSKILVFVAIALWTIAITKEAMHRKAQRDMFAYERDVKQIQQYKVYKDKYSGFKPSEDFKELRFQRELEKLMNQREQLWATYKSWE